MGIVAVVIGQIPVAYGMSPYLSLLIGPILIVVGVRYLGKPVDDGSTEPVSDMPSA